MSGMHGFAELDRNLQRLQQSALSIAGAAVAAGLGTLQRAGQDASPGTIKLEFGKRRKRVGTKVVGKVGLEVGRVRSKRPHGHFLTLGTKYIVARHFVRTAFESAVSRLQAVMQRAAARRMKSILEKGTG